MKKKLVRLTESDLHRIIKESVYSILNERRSIKSKKLFDILNKHKGFDSKFQAADIHNVQDEDIIGVVSYGDLVNMEKYKGGLRQYFIDKGFQFDKTDDVYTGKLKDGNYVLFIWRGAKFDYIKDDNRQKRSGDFEDFYNKQREREKNRIYRRGDYHWEDKGAEWFYKNPWRKNWSKEEKEKEMAWRRANKKN